jgi:hypothetical protein
MSTTVSELYTAPSAITISLGGLVNGSARQGTIVDNTTTGYPSIMVGASIKLGTSPTANTLILLYLIRDDGAASAPIRTDGAGASDAAITLKNAEVIGSLSTGASPATGDVLADLFPVDDPGPKFTVAVSNTSGVALDATNGNHKVEFVGINPKGS